MKTKFAAFLVAACLAPALQFAQSPSSSPAGDSGPGKFGRGLHGDRPHFSPEINARIEAARKKAMEDPKVQELKAKAEEANKAFREAMRDAVNKADPGLADEAKKFRLEKGEKRGEVADKANLQPAERDKLEEAMKIAKQAPAVQAAEGARKSATTPEQRHEAAKNYHKALREALLSADPSLAPILGKIWPSGGRAGQKDQKKEDVPASGGEAN